eukprot:g48186.t1
MEVGGFEIDVSAEMVTRDGDGEVQEGEGGSWVAVASWAVWYIALSSSWTALLVNVLILCFIFILRRLLHQNLNFRRPVVSATVALVETGQHRIFALCSFCGFLKDVLREEFLVSQWPSLSGLRTLDRGRN